MSALFLACHLKGIKDLPLYVNVRPEGEKKKNEEKKDTDFTRSSSNNHMIWYLQFSIPDQKFILLFGVQSKMSNRRQHFTVFTPLTQSLKFSWMRKTEAQSEVICLRSYGLICRQISTVLLLSTNTKQLIKISFLLNLGWKPNTLILPTNLCWVQLLSCPTMVSGPLFFKGFQILILQTYTFLSQGPLPIQKALFLFPHIYLSKFNPACQTPFQVKSILVVLCNILLPHPSRFTHLCGS